MLDAVETSRPKLHSTNENEHQFNFAVWFVWMTEMFPYQGFSLISRFHPLSTQHEKERERERERERNETKQNS